MASRVYLNHKNYAITQALKTFHFTRDCAVCAVAVVACSKLVCEYYRPNSVLLEPVRPCNCDTLHRFHKWLVIVRTVRCRRGRSTEAWLSRWCPKVCAAACFSASTANCSTSSGDRITQRRTQKSLSLRLLVAVCRVSPQHRLNWSRFSCSHPMVSCCQWHINEHPGMRPTFSGDRPTRPTHYWPKIVTTCECGCGNAFICISVCVSATASLSCWCYYVWKPWDTNFIFWCARTTSECLHHICMWKSSGQGQGHRSKKGMYERK